MTLQGSSTPNASIAIPDGAGPSQPRAALAAASRQVQQRDYGAGDYRLSHCDTSV
jgi:hypothetical protein